MVRFKSLRFMVRAGWNLSEALWGPGRWTFLQGFVLLRRPQEAAFLLAFWESLASSSQRWDVASHVVPQSPAFVSGRPEEPPSGESRPFCWR